ncbi:LamG-like jellyroll fold domain-containing protein [Streptomyces sp. NPDC051014]|uniref:LamG-like jellyroll fold domain-containing protein n=1 Tax=Streptomyces sp. NPDC051014 TaxID=3155751 RepID=UPI0034065514
MATIPKVTVEVAFDGGPFSSAYTWTDVSDFVTGLQVRRGRNNELDRIEAGTLSVTLDNSDGRFTPGKQKAGGNILSGYSGQYVWDVSGATSGRQVSSINVGQVDDDGLPRLMSRTVYTNGASVSCYFAVKWLDAGGATLRYVVGTRFIADSSPAVYTHSEAPPPGTATAVVTIWADSFPDGSTGLTMYGEKAEWYKTQPYYPNVVPRRRVRVRTANLTPKEVSTGGEVTRSASQFYTGGQAGQSSAWSSFAKSGAGAVQVNFGNNGTADFASGVYCGYMSARRPLGTAKVVAGQTYSCAAQVRLGFSSPALSVKCRIRWYDSDGGFIGVSDSGAAWPLQKGTYLSVSNTGLIAPANAAWAAIQIGTTGGDGAGSGYVQIDEVQLELGSTLSPWSPGGSIFHGYIEKWPVTTEGLTAQVEVSAVDGFSVFSNTDLRAAMQAEVLTTGPLGYWTLGDPVGATRLENLANDQQPAKLANSKYGAGTPLLGADSVVAKDSTTCYSLANVSVNQGTVVDICNGGQRNYPLGTAFSVAFWCLPVRPSSGMFNTLFAGWSDSGADFLWIRIDSSGKLQITTTYTDGTQTVFVSNSALSTSKPSFVAVTLDQGVTRLYLNGAYQQQDSGPTPTNVDIRDLRWASFAGRQAGSIYAEYANGRIGHVAIWDKRIVATDLDPIWRLGDNGGVDFSEDEATRIDRIAQMAFYQGETAYDSGKSVLQGPSWSDGTSALDELQGAAEDASGYIFMDGDGRLTYHNRDRRQGAPVRYTLADSQGLPYEPGLQFEMDEDRIINEVSYKRTNGIEGVLKDQASIDAFGRKSKSIELRVTSDSSVQDAAYNLLGDYSQPVVRCDSVTLNCSATPDLFFVALGVEVGDRITLADLPSQAPESSLDFYVEAIQTDVSVNGGTVEWVTSLSLSPAGNSDVWVLEDPTLGRLDRTSVLAY